MPLPVAVAIEMLILYIFFTNIKNITFKFIESAIFIFATTVALTLILRYIPVFGISAFVGNFTSVIILILVSNLKVKPLLLGVSYALLTSIIIVLAANLTSAAISLFYIITPGFVSIGRDAVMDSILMYFLYNSILFVFGFAISRWFGSTFHTRLLYLDEALKQRISAYMFFGAVITLILFFTNTFLHQMLMEAAMLNTVYALSLTGLFIYFIFIKLAYMDGLRKEIELRHQEELILSMEDRTNQIEEMSLGLRNFRHDHMNLMINFRTYMEDKDWDSLNNYYNNYVGELSGASVSLGNCSDKLAKIKSREIKNLLLVKFTQAHNLNISTSIEVRDSAIITDSHTLLHATRLIGIYMDNAIEACKGVDNARIMLLATVEDGVSHFTIINTCQTPPPMNKIHTKGFSTKGDARGMGLYIASQILSKNEKISTKTSMKDGEFIQDFSVVD